MKILTKAEESIIQVLWQLGEGFLNDIMNGIAAPKPHQNTVATILKIMVEKGFVGIRVIGRQHQYYPIISKSMYSKASIKNLVKNYFGGSFNEVVSFMVKEKNISMEDLETLLQQLKKENK